MIVFEEKEYQSLTEPLTIEQVKSGVDENNYLTGVVKIDLGDIIDADLEGFLDILSEALIGTNILMDITYSAVGQEGNLILLAVTGDCSALLNYEEDEEEEIVNAKR